MEDLPVQDCLRQKIQDLILPSNKLFYNCLEKSIGCQMVVKSVSDRLQTAATLWEKLVMGTHSFVKG